MSMVNQYNGFGGNPGYPNWPNFSQSYQPYTAVQKPLYDSTRPSGDCLKRVKGLQSAMQFPMNPNSRDVLFDEDNDIHIVYEDTNYV